MLTEDMDYLYKTLRAYGMGGRGLRRCGLVGWRGETIIPSRDALFIATQNGDGWNSDDPRDFLPPAVRRGAGE